MRQVLKKPAAPALIYAGTGAETIIFCGATLLDALNVHSCVIQIHSSFNAEPRRLAYSLKHIRFGFKLALGSPFSSIFHDGFHQTPAL